MHYRLGGQGERGCFLLCMSVFVSVSEKVMNIVSVCVFLLYMCVFVTIIVFNVCMCMCAHWG